jgi:voltage-gated potassium channel
MTTVGYGDIVPQTVLGQLLAAVVMLLGFGIIAIPTGIITVETMEQVRRGGRECVSCGAQTHRAKALHCDQCGATLPPAVV